MKKILFIVTMVLSSIATAQLSPIPTYCDNRTRPCVIMNDTGSYFGQVMNTGANTWGLGYAAQTSGKTSNGTSALTWNTSGVVTIPGTLSLTGSIGDLNTTGNVGIGTTAATRTLNVTGTTSLVALNTTGNVGIGTTAATKTLTVTGSSTLTGNSSIGGTLNVTGASTLGSTLHVVGALDTDSTLVVDGASTLNGAVTISNGITGSGAGLTSLTAANISAGSLGGSVIASSVAAGVIVDSNLAGSISPSKITGTAAVLGGNTFSGPIYVASGANVSSVTATGINTPAVVAETSIQGATITGVTYVSGGYVIANSFISLTPKSLATIHTSTPTATDQIHLCSDCVNGFLVRSTGTTNCFDWSSANSLTQPE